MEDDSARLGEWLGVDPDTASQTYYACLLFYVGCTADAEVAASQPGLYFVGLSFLYAMSSGFLPRPIRAG